jgi:hypothetical protein
VVRACKVAKAGRVLLLITDTSALLMGDPVLVQYTRALNQA